jgi:hypothetical protein
MLPAPKPMMAWWEWLILAIGLAFFAANLCVFLYKGYREPVRLLPPGALLAIFWLIHKLRTRRMPWWEWLILAMGLCIVEVAVCVFVYYKVDRETVRETGSLLALCALVAIFWVIDEVRTRRMRQLAASRKGEGVGKFARSFDRRTDTWILRAVYEELSRHLAIDDRPFPVRRADHLRRDLKVAQDSLCDWIRDMAFRAQRSVGKKDLRIDLLSLTLVGNMAFPAERSLDGAEKNPLYRKVQMVGDIVTFLEHQPRIANVETTNPAAGPQPSRVTKA